MVNLGTRVPYRHRGIAQAMLVRWVEAGRASGCRSLMINATDGGRPAGPYRRRGFIDEIYRYQSYEGPEFEPLGVKDVVDAALRASDAQRADTQERPVDVS